MSPETADSPSWRQAFAPFATPSLPEIDLVFGIRVEADYYYSVIRHAVIKAHGYFADETVAAFLEEALVAYVEAEKGKAGVASPEALERAEALVPAPTKGRGGKVLRVDLAKRLKRDVVTRLVLRKYGANPESGKRSLAKEALLARIEACLRNGSPAGPAGPST
jgi:hypothetical protein